MASKIKTRCFPILPAYSSMFFGSSRFISIAITKITDTTFCAKMDCTATGNSFQIPASVEAVKPFLALPASHRQEQNV